MPRPKLRHQALHTQPGQRIERPERLVEQQQFGLANQRARQTYTLRLSARQGRRPGVDTVAQGDFIERLDRSAASVVLESDRDVTPHAPPWQQPRLLEHHRASWRHRDRPGIRHVEPGQHTKQGRLA